MSHRSSSPKISPIPLPSLVRLSTAAATLDTAVETLRYWMRSGRLSSVKIGRNLYLLQSEIQQLIEEGKRLRRASPRIESPSRGGGR